ncbi:hypothetical protein E4T50_13922 [Aureobasidium sp. EXF-12298]|nr:hypothetical protein E4T50_13922 [Aureobasidium sp. EXF-12298]KAI4757531.1 hypothetical protein E4T51_09420 [Aureobasidium sp. EXF-12344]KAI4770511.1 hypothetical protein E4T52_14485 [Aureobasidium sp. EXF-3400]
MSSSEFMAERAKDDGIDWASSHGFFAQMGGFRLSFHNLEAQGSQRTSIKELSPGKHSIAAPSQEPLLGRLSFPHANYWEHASATSPTVESQLDLLSNPVDVAVREKSFKSVSWDLASISRQHDALSASFGPVDWSPDIRNGALIEQMMYQHQSDPKAGDVALTAMGMTTDIWTLSLEQIQLARKYGIIETFPNMKKEDLDAISNSDGLAKALAVCQVLWLIIQMISRAASSLAVCQLEVATGAFAITTFLTYMFLWQKPQGVSRPIYLEAVRRPTVAEAWELAQCGPSNSAHAHASDNKHELASPPPPATRHHIQSLPVLSKVEPEEEAQDPPPFASHNFPSLYFPPEPQLDVQPAPPPPDFEQGPSSSASSPFSSVVQDTKAALPQDTKPRSDKAPDDSEPPPPYTEGTSPLDGFTYLMAQAGGAASIITQVSQGGPAPINTFHTSPDEHINIDLRGTRFTLSRDELLTLPEFVLLSLFPNGLLPEGHMNSFHEPDVYPVDVSAAPRLISSLHPQDIAALQNVLQNHDVYLSDSIYLSQYDPTSLQYMLEFFRSVAQTIPTSPTEDSPSPFSGDQAPVPIEPMQGNARDMLQDRAGIIVLREDLDFYVIPPRRDISHPEMVQVKRAAGRALLKQGGIFSGLRKSEEPGTTEQHLIEMLTAGGFNHDDTWGHRAGEPNKAVICSIALARLRTDVRGDANSNAVGMAQKLLLFWRKPARRCWWEGVDLENVEGIDGTLKVWIRRVWTLEMSVIGLR